MPKEKSINPAQAQRKADKAKAVKKGKAEAQTRRNEKLARRNPTRLQTQLDDLKAIETSGGRLTTHEKTLLESLEKDVKAVKKAREALGDAAPKFGGGGGEGGGRGSFGGRGGRGGRDGGVLGKRRRDEESSEDDSILVPEDVKSIPMPRDTPPPIPKEVLDKWYQKRRERMGITQNNHTRPAGAGAGTSANSTPLGANDRSAGFGNKEREEVRQRPVEQAKTVYESAPQVRDLRREAVSFVPAAVRAKLDRGKGVGGLVEPEEADRLEREGYMNPTTRKVEEVGDEGMDQRGQGQRGARAVMVEEVEYEDG